MRFRASKVAKSQPYEVVDYDNCLRGPLKIKKFARPKYEDFLTRKRKIVKEQLDMKLEREERQKKNPHAATAFRST